MQFTFSENGLGEFSITRGLVVGDALNLISDLTLEINRANADSDSPRLVDSCDCGCAERCGVVLSLTEHVRCGIRSFREREFIQGWASAYRIPLKGHVDIRRSSLEESEKAVVVPYVMLGVLVMFLLYLIVTFNGLVSRRNMIANAWSTIDVMLKKRHDLIPNLVKSVKGYAEHEKELFERIATLRSQSVAGSPQEKLKLESDITPLVSRLLAIGESYPELRSSDQFLNLQRSLTEVEEQISASRRTFNSAVYGMNNSVESFPSNIVAGMFGFKKHTFFEVSEAERQSVSL